MTEERRLCWPVFTDVYCCCLSEDGIDRYLLFFKRVGTAGPWISKYFRVFSQGNAVFPLYL